MAKSNTSNKELQATAGIVTDLAGLLRSRHWAQRLKLFSDQAARNMMLGNLRSRFRGRGMEFEEVRRYQPGDDIRNIDWKVSARAQGTYTKLFCEERERPCHILVDQRSHLFFGSSNQFKSVLAAEIAAAIAWAALAGGDRVGGQVIGDTAERDSRARRSKQAVLGFIHDLNELNHQLLETPNNLTLAPTQSIANSLEECRRITRPGTAIFVISDFQDFDAAAAKALSNLSKHADISMLQITDELEQELPLSGNLAISNGLQHSRVKVSNSVQKNYLAAIEQQRLLLKNAAAQARALFVTVDTKQRARQALIKIFGQS